MRKKSTKPVEIDTSFARAAQLVLPRNRDTRVILVGCGGTGSWLAPAIVRLARVMIDMDRKIEVAFVDPDTVEAVNVPRQNFCEAEIGRNKARTLAARFSMGWGIEIESHPVLFRTEIHPRASDLNIIVGCVDNAAGRRAIATALKLNVRREIPCSWWLDCGNSSDHGQVLLGSTADKKQLTGAFPSPRICHALPSPALQKPDLLTARAEETDTNKMSCAELQAANAQSLAINQRVAAEAADYLMRMLIGPGLRRFATVMDLVTGSARSRAITPEEVLK